PRVDEFREVVRQLPLQASGEDRPCADVVPRREPTRDHQDVELIELPLHVRWCIPRELLEVDLLRPGPEGAEVRDGLVLAVRPLDQEDPDADVGDLHETTTRSGIASLHAFRIAATAARTPSRPRVIASSVPPTRPISATGTPAIAFRNSCSRPFRVSTSHRPL